MATFSSHPNQRPTFYTHETKQPKKTGLVEKIAVVVSVAAIASFIVVDIVRTAPADAVMTQTTFDTAPDSRWAVPSMKADEQWAADDSARGSRPDSIH